MNDGSNPPGRKWTLLNWIFVVGFLTLQVFKLAKQEKPWHELGTLIVTGILLALVTVPVVAWFRQQRRQGRVPILPCASGVAAFILILILTGKLQFDDPAYRLRDALVNFAAIVTLALIAYGMGTYAWVLWSSSQELEAQKRRRSRRPDEARRR